MSFLKILWGIITMWELWLAVALVLIGTFIVACGFNYLMFVLFNPILAIVFSVIGVLLIVTTVVWIAENAN